MRISFVDKLMKMKAGYKNGDFTFWHNQCWQDSNRCKTCGKAELYFYDLDEVIKKKFQTTLKKFMKDNPFTYERSRLKGKILSDVIRESTENIVIAVSPIWYARFFNRLLDLDQVIAIELQDSEENIFQRLVFSDEEDNIYRDDEYKEQRKEHYIKDIHEDIMYAKNLFRKIENKYFINNQSVDLVVDGLIVMIHNMLAKTAPNSH